MEEYSLSVEQGKIFPHKVIKHSKGCMGTLSPSKGVFQSQDSFLCSRVEVIICMHAFPSTFIYIYKTIYTYIYIKNIHIYIKVHFYPFIFLQVDVSNIYIYIYI